MGSRRPEKERDAEKEVREMRSMTKTGATLAGLKVEGAVWKTQKGHELENGFFPRVSTDFSNAVIP